MWMEWLDPEKIEIYFEQYWFCTVFGDTVLCLSIQHLFISDYLLLQ